MVVNKLKEVSCWKTNDLPEITVALYEKLKADGYSDTVLDNTRWILEHFGNYSIRKKIPDITVPIVAAFVQECFGFDYYNLTARMQSVLRRPLMILIEYEESGNYLKIHQKGSTTEIPLVYRELFLEYSEGVNATSLCQNSKERKLWIFVKCFEDLEQYGILKAADIQFGTVHEYINGLTSLPLQRSTASRRHFVKSMTGCIPAAILPIPAGRCFQCNQERSPQ